MELNAVDGMLPVAERMNLSRVICRTGDDFEARGERARFHDEGMIPHDFERRRKTRKEASSRVRDVRRLAVHNAFRADYASPVRLADRLMPQAHAQGGDRAPPAADRVDRDPGFTRRARPGRQDDRPRMQRADLLDADRVVASNVDIHA
jgi:hypothetical protein